MWAADVLSGRIARGNRYFKALAPYFTEAEGVSPHPASFKRAFLTGVVYNSAECGRNFLNGFYQPGKLTAHVRSDAQMLGLFRALTIIAGSTYLYGPNAPSDQELAQYHLTREGLSERLQHICLSKQERNDWNEFCDTRAPLFTEDTGRWVVGACGLVWGLSGGGVGLPGIDVNVTDGRRLFDMAVSVRTFMSERSKLRKEWKHSHQERS